MIAGLVCILLIAALVFILLWNRQDEGYKSGHDPRVGKFVNDCVIRNCNRLLPHSKEKKLCEWGCMKFDMYKKCLDTCPTEWCKYKCRLVMS